MKNNWKELIIIWMFLTSTIFCFAQDNYFYANGEKSWFTTSENEILIKLHEEIEISNSKMGVSFYIYKFPGY
jgi:hypothetical protein